MADQRALEAIRRAEQALTRIESATSRAPSPDPAFADLDEFQRLRDAHDQLRERVAGAIDEIDRLIERGERN